MATHSVKRFIQSLLRISPGESLKTALRSLAAQRLPSLLNVVGLAVGFTVCILVFLYVRDELDYDRFHAKAPSIHRVAVERQYPNALVTSAKTPRSLARALADDFPEVRAATRLSREHAARVLVQNGAERFYEEGVLFADANVFDVFSWPLLAGSAATALREPRSIVVTQSMARKYFGAADPVGRTLTLRLLGDGDLFDYTVTAVAADPPRNSHVAFDFLASYEGHPFTTTANVERISYENLDVYTYVLLHEHADPDALERKLPALLRDYLGPSLEQSGGPTLADYLAAGNNFRYFLQPLVDIHLRSRLSDELLPPGDIRDVMLLAALAVFIMLLACINFANLATARSALRAREIGLRKTLGSRRGQLVRLFLLESILLSFLALAPALGFVELLLPFLNQFTGKTLTFGYFADWRPLVTVGGLVLSVGLVAGLYPALFLSALRPAQALRGGTGQGGGTMLRNALVVFQFGIAIVLIVGTVVIVRQLAYVGSKKLGFDEEAVVILEGTEVLKRQPEAFRQAVLGVPGVLGVANGESAPGRPFERSLITLEDGTAEAQVAWMFTGFDYLETLGMRVLQGRSFSSEIAGDRMGVVLNEKAVSDLGLTEPLGRRVTWGTRTYTVIGVVENFNFASLHNAVEPMMMIGLDPEFENRPYQLFAVRLDMRDPQGTLTALGEVWNDFVPQQPFAYGFLDRDLDALYRAEEAAGSLIGLGTLLAIFIACLGLFGLASFATERRKKEIGVRKVLGGSAWSIVLLLTSDFSRLVLLANLLAWPVAYMAASRWLENFAYRIDLTPLIFLGSGAIALCIAWVTVGAIAAKAANAKPALALRYE